MQEKPGLDLQALIAALCFVIATFWAPLCLAVYWVWMR